MFLIQQTLVSLDVLEKEFCCDLGTCRGCCCIEGDAGAPLTAEEEARVAEIQNDLSRYAEKAMACFVTGDTELTDENWNTFCSTVEEKGLQELIGIWQKVLH